MSSPQQVIADELAGDFYGRQEQASDILKALMEHGYAVVTVVEPEENPDA